MTAELPFVLLLLACLACFYLGYRSGGRRS
jgi:hypothetical protein